MTRAPAALVLLLGLSGTRTVEAAPCAPRAQLEGDGEAIQQVAAELAKLGVTIAPATSTCPSLAARVELDDGGGIAVAVHAAAERSEGRVVSDAALAAAWIDSWARDDLDVATWPGPTTTTTVAAPPPTITPPSTTAPSDATPAPSKPSVFERVTFAGAYELAQASDGSAFTGFGVSACVHVSGVCLGARVRVGFEPQLTSGLTAAARSDMSLLATASVPVAIGQMMLAPEAGLGVGRFSTRRLDGCEPVAMQPPNTCNPMTDPTCLMDPADGTGMCEPDANGTVPGSAGKLYVGDNFDNATYTPRVALALRVAVPLVKHVWLDGFAGIELMPLGHGDPFVPAMVPAGVMTAEDAKLPGEPWHSARVGIGLRVGAP